MGKWSYEAATAAMVGAGAIAMSLFMWSVGPSTSMIGRAIFYWQNCLSNDGRANDFTELLLFIYLSVSLESDFAGRSE